MKVITSWSVLMKLARDVGQAKISGNKEQLIEAQRKLDDYKKLILLSDKLNLECTINELS